MELVFFDLIDAGFFEAFWNWNSVSLTVGIYLCVLFGAVAQYLLGKKCTSWVSRGALVWLCLLGLFAGEVSRLFITGWDLLFIYIAYGFVFCILLGAGIMLIIQTIKKRYKKSVISP